jgi:hypothetical protein
MTAGTRQQPASAILPPNCCNLPQEWPDATTRARVDDFLR